MASLLRAITASVGLNFACRNVKSSRSKRSPIFVPPNPNSIEGLAPVPVRASLVREMTSEFSLKCCATLVRNKPTVSVARSVRVRTGVSSRPANTYKKGREREGGVEVRYVFSSLSRVTDRK